MIKNKIYIFTQNHHIFRVKKSLCHNDLWHFFKQVRVWYRHFDHKNPKLNFMFGLGFFVCADCSHLLSTQVESGAPSERSKWELAHDLRAKCYEQHSTRCFLSSRPPMTKPDTRDRVADLVIFV